MHDEFWLFINTDSDLATSTGNATYDSEVRIREQGADDCIKTTKGPVYCYGEILGYGAYSGTKMSLANVASDWERGKPHFDRLSGRFLLVIYDEQTTEWNFITDPLGSFHIYAVWEKGRIKAIGTDLADLAKSTSKRALDWEAITSFFAFSFFLDDRTYFEDVRILLPGSVYRVSADGRLLEQRQYWKWEHRVDANRSYSDTIDEYHALLQHAVNRCTSEGRVLLPISGGLDSRSLASVVPTDKAIQTYSYGYTSSSIETKIATQIAEARGFSFTPHVISSYLFDCLPQIVAVLHGSQDVTQARQVSIVDWMKSHGDTVLTGLWGDVWCDQMGLADGLPANVSLTSYAVKKFRKRGSNWLLEHISSAQLTEKSISTLLSTRVGDGLSDLEHIEDADFRFKIYKTTRWAFRWSNASLRAFEVGAAPRIPYYDVDLVAFFCTVPTAFARDRRLQIDHLKRYAPDLARITWQETDTSLYLARYARWIRLPKRAYRRFQRQFHNVRPIQRNWEVQFLTPNGRDNLRRWLLQPNLRLHEFVSPQIISTLMDSFFASPAAANGYTVSMLLTFSAWLEAID